ncbi:hypothetical protein VUR80DRAFT_2322 [Thermomyces stellatus]
MGFHCFSLTKKRRLIITITISLSFFLLELTFGFRTGSLALIADAFHYLNDLIGFSVALIALLISERRTTPSAFSFGWQRGELLGGFFNGVFLLALGISILLQSVERFTKPHHVDDPMTVLILGSVGLFLNIVTLFFLRDHGHDHGDNGSHNHDNEHCQVNDKSVDPGTSSSNTVVPIESPPCPSSRRASRQSASRHHEHRHVDLKFAAPGDDLNMLGVILHVIGDAVNNIGVIVAALAIWKAKSDKRFYADPAVSLFIAIMIFVSAVPLVKNSGLILLQSAPLGVDIGDIEHDLGKIPGVESVHELHVWRLNERKAFASAHVVVSDESVAAFIETARHINECLHAYGVHSVTLQPESSACSRIRNRVARLQFFPLENSGSMDVVGARGRVAGQEPQNNKESCQLVCAKVSED